MHCMHRLIITFSVFVLVAIQPVVAQFEVSPDHFDQVRIVQTAQSTRAEEKLKQSITEEMALLKSYTEQIAEKERQVEDLRQQAISAGISGDGAAMEIAWFRNQQEELITFRASLGPLIDEPPDAGRGGAGAQKRSRQVRWRAGLERPGDDGRRHQGLGGPAGSGAGRYWLPRLEEGRRAFEEWRRGIDRIPERLDGHASGVWRCHATTGPGRSGVRRVEARHGNYCEADGTRHLAAQVCA